MRTKTHMNVSSLWKLTAYSLSGRLLLLTTLFVLLSEFLIFAPSIGRIHRASLESHILAGELAVMPFNEPEAKESPGAAPTELPAEIPLAPTDLPTAAESPKPIDGVRALKQSMLQHADAIAITVKRADFRNYYPVGVRAGATLTGARRQRHIDLNTHNIYISTLNGLECLMRGGNGRILYITAPTHIRGAQEIGVFVDEAPIRAALIQSAKRLIVSGLFVSLFSAFLVFLSLYMLLVRPMRRIAKSMAAFREDPEDASRILVPRASVGEIGQAETELAAMQSELFAFLRQKTHLAALGTAVARIQHDLRNILSTALIASDRLTASADPAVRRLAPNLVAAIERAVNLATNTLKFVRVEETPPVRTHFPLSPLVQEAAATALGTDADTPSPIQFQPIIPAGLSIFADRDQIFRVLLNLIRNAAQALGSPPWTTPPRIEVLARPVEGGIEIDVADTGPGIPETVQDKLFQPFAIKSRSGGTGLGLAIARELVRAHGGELTLHSTGATGTAFRMHLPDPPQDDDA